MLLAELGHVSIEGAVVDEFLDDQLHEILHVRIGTLLDEGKLIDDGLRGGEQSQS